VARGAGAGTWHTTHPLLLTDCGAKILSVYMSSSKNMSYDSASLTCSDIKWLGLRPTDLDKYKVSEGTETPPAPTRPVVTAAPRLNARLCLYRFQSSAAFP
jgi:DNA topoisomerase VI subunit A